MEKSLEVLRTTGERLDAQALKLRKEVGQNSASDSEVCSRAVCGGHVCPRFFSRKF